MPSGTPIPVLEIAGTADPVMPFTGGEIKLLGFNRGAAVLSAKQTISMWTNNAKCKKPSMLNRDEAVNALKRAIYTGRVAVHQARRDDEMQAVADALSLLANIVMAWNTAQMQAVIDRWNNRRREQIPAKLIGRIAPTRIFNLRGVFRFPIERFAGQILPSLRSSKTGANAR
jgi:hypothetical protein